MNDLKQKIKNNKAMYFVAHYSKEFLFWSYEKIATPLWRVKSELIQHGIMKQDLRFERIKDLKDTHCGERCFIVATGPSVTHKDLDVLNNEFTISMNSIVNILPEVEYMPDIYMCQDLSVYERIEKNIDRVPHERIFIGIINSNINYFLDTGIKLRHVKRLDDIGLFHLDSVSNVFHINFEKSKIKFDFSDNCYRDIKDGTTITYAAVQLAAYMGFKDIYLVGVDCNYTGSIRHIGECNPDQDYSDIADDIVRNFNIVFGHAYKELKKRNINLMNATRGGNLRSVPRENFDELLINDIQGE